MLNNFSNPETFENLAGNFYHLSELGGELSQLYLENPPRWEGTGLINLLERIFERLDGCEDNLNRE